jgi:hypothetical protein
VYYFKIGSTHATACIVLMHHLCVIFSSLTTITI